jgi:hypothetical protein
VPAVVPLLVCTMHKCVCVLSECVIVCMCLVLYLGPHSRFPCWQMKNRTSEREPSCRPTPADSSLLRLYKTSELKNPKCLQYQPARGSNAKAPTCQSPPRNTGDAMFSTPNFDTCLRSRRARICPQGRQTPNERSYGLNAEDTETKCYFAKPHV